MLLEHNIPVYNNLEQTLKTNDKAIVIMGTGVGKTYVTTEYLNNHNLKALVVSPRNIINKSWVNHTDRVEAMTYQKFARVYKELDYSKYDLIIADEVHHIGAKNWGKPFKYIFENNIIKVIGLTENSIRYLDGGRDVSEELFDNNVCRGESAQSAIEKGILNKITYVGAYYNTDGIRDEYKGKITDKLYSKLNLILNNTPTVEEIVKNNMPKGNRKGIVFVSSIEEINEAIEMLKNIYPNLKYKIIHSKQPEKVNKESMEWFEKTNNGYLFSVNMISEGVHIKGVNTLLMLRKTSSPSIFSQQMGRCLDAKSRQEAILFDLVNNKNNLRMMYSKERKQSLGPVVPYENVAGSQIIVKDYTKDICEVLEEIERELDSKYTLEEDEIIKNSIANNLKINQIVALLPNRTFQSVRSRIYHLGLRYSNKKLAENWSEEEIAIIKEHFPKLGGSKEMRNLLCGRSSQTINQKAKSLGLKNPNNHCLTNQDIKFIKENYPTKGNKYCAEKLGITNVTIKNYIKKLGLKNHANKLWTNEENEILKKYYPVEGKNVYKRLDGRNPYACKTQAIKLGYNLKKRGNDWSEEEIETLKKYYPIEGKFCYIRFKNRTKVSITKKAFILGIRKED